MQKGFQYAVFSNIGGRQVNEDSVGVFRSGERCCYILCDGLGGHGMGDAASSLVVSVFEEMFSKADDVSNFIGQTLTVAQERLLCEQVALNAKRKMKTTAVVAVTDERNAYIGHIGDSRGYVFHGKRIKMRTLDHSIPQMLVLSHEIKESEIRNHPDRNTLLRVMGVDWDEAMYELSAPIPLKKCQAFLLCSDGFWELIDESEMCTQLKKSNSAEEWLSGMVGIVEKNGEGRDMDNYSAIAVWKE